MGKKTKIKQARGTHMHAVGKRNERIARARDERYY